MRGKINVKKRGKRTQKIRLRFFPIVVGLIAGGLYVGETKNVHAENCPDVKIVFARGSGGERWNDQNYLSFKSTIETKLKTTGLNYEFVDLDYPAVGVGIDNLEVTAGAFFGAGESYEFGESVNTGVQNLRTLVNDARCPNTKYVLGGYSQGAMVISKTLNYLLADKIIYAATFGDPKIYLPEGWGIMPAACQGIGLSSYRMYVPDCQAYKGLLGGYVPYEPEHMKGKVGTWCNKRDIFCSSKMSVSDHVSYVSENLYEDASRVIFDKITKAFELENHISSPHDTAILIDSTGSMERMIGQYKAEALRLAKQTLESGGRVALYDYRDLSDPYEAVEHCNFETCTLELFEAELDAIGTTGGGDEPESLLSSSLKVMNELKWKRGSTKSLVVLTDANFLSPDRDGTTLWQVIQLSKTIDPVNFYIITHERWVNQYAELVAGTDGKFVTNLNELNLLTDYIMDRYDSLPRVEESETNDELPTLNVDDVTWNDDETAQIHFSTNGEQTLVILNDKILGVTNEKNITVNHLKKDVKNVVTLVPIKNDVRGEAIDAQLNDVGYGSMTDDDGMTIPKAPNTGRR